ncbi:hypothetical protein ALC53_05595, partial [Atta colombica]
ASRFETVFLCTHPKGPKMSQLVAAKYIKKSRYNIILKSRYNIILKQKRWMICQNVICHSVYQKDIKRVVSLFEKYSTLRQGQAILKKKV